MGFNWVLPNYFILQSFIGLLLSFLIRLFYSSVGLEILVYVRRFHSFWNIFALNDVRFFSFLTRNCCYLEDLRVRI